MTTAREVDAMASFSYDTRTKNARRTATKNACLYQKTPSEKIWRAWSLDLLDLLDLIRATSQTRQHRNHHKQQNPPRVLVVVGEVAGES
jgi:hypothetical protein